MAKNVVLNLKIDSKDGVKSIGDINKEAKTTLKTLDQMEQASEAINTELKKVNVGTKEYKKLRSELVKVNKEIKNQELALEALDTEQLTSTLKGAIGGVADLGSGIALLGLEGENIDQLVNKIAQIEGVQRLVTGSLEAYTEGLKFARNSTLLQTIASNALSASQALYSTIVGASTGALKLFRIALASTGIGALVVGIGLLVSNFDAVKTAVTSFGKAIVEVFKALVAPLTFFFGLFTDGEEEMTKSAEGNAEARRKAIESEIKANKRKQSELDDTLKVQQKTSAKTQLLLEREIELRKAKGKDTSELELDKQKQLLESLKTERKIVAQKIELIQAEFKARTAITILTFEQIKATQTTFRDSLNQLKDIINEIGNVEQDIKVTIAENTTRTSNSDEEREIEEINLEAIRDARTSVANQKLEEDEKLIESMKKYTDVYNDEMDLILEKQAMQIENNEALAQSFENASIAFGNAISASLLGNFSDINEAFNQLSFYLFDEENGFFAKLESGSLNIGDTIAVGLQTTTQVLDAINQRQIQNSLQASEQIYDAQSEDLKVSLANREISQRQYDAKLILLEKDREAREKEAEIKNFRQSKATALVNATIAGAQAVISAFARTGPIGATIAGVLTATQLGVIASQRLKLNRGGIIPGAASNVDTIPAHLSRGESVINSTSTAMFAPLLSLINELGGGRSFAPNVSSLALANNGNNQVFQSNNQQQVLKAYVVESEISESQRRVKRIEDGSVF